MLSTRYVVSHVTWSVLGVWLKRRTHESYTQHLLAASFNALWLKHYAVYSNLAASRAKGDRLGETSGGAAREDPLRGQHHREGSGQVRKLKSPVHINRLVHLQNTFSSSENPLWQNFEADSKNRCLSQADSIEFSFCLSEQWWFHVYVWVYIACVHVIVCVYMTFVWKIQGSTRVHWKGGYPLRRSRYQSRCKTTTQILHKLQ